MCRRNLIKATMAAMISLPLQVLAVDQPLDLSPLFADMSPTYSGNEVIVPYVIGGPDSNFDGLPDSATLKLRIFTPATTTTAQVLRYLTPGRVVLLPSNPCSNPLDTVWQFDSKPLRDKEMVAVAYNYTVLCTENDGYYTIKSAAKTVIYVADASKSNGVAWALGYNRPLAGFNLVDDQNSDGYQELMIATQDPYDPLATAYAEIRNLLTNAIINKGAFATTK